MPSRKTTTKTTTTPKPAPKVETPTGEAAAPTPPPPPPPPPPPSEGEGVLAEVATTTVPGVQPTVDPQPPEVTIAATHTQAATDPWRPIYVLEEARALPECPRDLAVPGEAPANERQIQAFKDTDGRTMVIGKDIAGRMVKVEAWQP